MNTPLTLEGRAETSKSNGFGPTQRTHQEQHVLNIIAGVKVVDVASTSRPLQVEDLYPVAVGRGQLLATARGLLFSGYERLARAQVHLSEGDNVASDYEVSLFQAELPELFCCAISEGLSTLVVAVHHALKNRGPSPLSAEQLNNLKFCIGRITKEIFLSYDAVLDMLDELEACGLNIDPPEAETLGALLNESVD